MRTKVDRSQVVHELLPGVSVELLKELHLLTRDGDLNADSRRKLKQVNHFLGLLRPAVDDVLARHREPVIVDAAAGKGYLGFLLQATALGPAGRGRLWSLETRGELATAAAGRAERLGMGGMRFVHGAIADVEAELPERIHLLVALHACDTATDDALALALRRGADHVAVVPCCQAEVARQLAAAAPADPAAAALHAHPWHRREFGSHLTNVIRALVLEAQGYRVTVTELAGWEHSLKNELILAKRVQRYDAAAAAALEAVLARHGVEPALVRAVRAGATATSGET